jgi:hypothetical protein
MTLLVKTPLWVFAVTMRWGRWSFPNVYVTVWLGLEVFAKEERLAVR